MWPLVLALLLLEFEMMAPLSLHSWTGHAYGSAHLLAQLTPEACQTSPLFEIFWQLRFTMVCLHMGTRPFEATRDVSPTDSSIGLRNHAHWQVVLSGRADMARDAIPVSWANIAGRTTGSALDKMAIRRAAHIQHDDGPTNDAYTQQRAIPQPTNSAGLVSGAHGGGFQFGVGRYGTRAPRPDDFV